MIIKEELRYTKEHEWVKLENEVATVGITDYAQAELGDIVFIELPKVGSKVEYMKPFGVIEAVKAVSELFSPVTGEVVGVNSKLESEAGLINKDPYEKGWIIKIRLKDQTEIDKLLTADEYKKMLENK